ncbi:hypothetical protein GCM10009677_03150 [Sphaerisporangium rubeum]|uniref:Cell division protein FtsK n=1 Tax=Sphaerisporangium rubeum TaxID=321317 RepID=A0A7X0IDR8_9ACTN|nr:hypothetical protein [Sphaerisporangium rubeum]MBB6473266.1 hypothetical protein [Sphaerisporangium rubeum]
MTHEPFNPNPDADPSARANGHQAKVVELDAVRDRRNSPPVPGTGEQATSSDTAYEVVLDEQPPADDTPPAVDLADAGATVVTRRRPIIPAGLRRANLPHTLSTAMAEAGYVAGFHTVRSPWYLLKVASWSVVGLVRLMGRRLRWWAVSEQYALLQQAATDNDPAMWLKLSREGRAIRRWHGIVLIGQLIALITAVSVGVAVLPVWGWLLVAGVVVPLLAHQGRPAGAAIVSPVVVKRRYRKLNSDIVLRAYYAAGLGHPDRADQQIEFGTQMARDGNGSKVLINLPYGRTFGEAVKAREKIASGLDVSLSQVTISRDAASNRSHWLWVADADPLAIPAGRTPLLACKETDIWQPAPLGVDERGRAVALLMLWTSILVGAQPRQGKSFTARLLALYAALDPYVRLDVFDGKGSPDWRKFALVAHSCSFGFTMTRDGDPLEIFVQTLRDLKADVQDRYQRLSELPVEVCPEGKLTRDIARDPKYRMPVRLVVIDECQEYFDTGDKELNKEISALMVYLVKVAPAAGVIVLDATQKPGGVGTGDTATAFTSFRDNHQTRIALRTGSWQVSDLVLGSGAYSEGFDSSALLPGYKGVGILRGASDETPTVRFHLADAEDAEKILTAARALRQRAGTLSGHAAGQSTIREVRDVLADVLSVFQSAETGLPWTLTAARLAERIPEHYAEVTPEAISAQVRALGVPSVDIKRDGKSLKGAKKTAITDAIARRQATAG